MSTAVRTSAFTEPERPKNLQIRCVTIGGGRTHIGKGPATPLPHPLRDQQTPSMPSLTTERLTVFGWGIPPVRSRRGPRRRRPATLDASAGDEGVRLAA